MSEFPLSSHQEAQLIEAIRQIESQCSAELRIHLESECQGDAFAQAVEIFAELGMEKTRYQNGILIYVAYKTRKYALLADAGIHQKVKGDYWEKLGHKMAEFFKANQFLEGLLWVLEQAGQVLIKHFPLRAGEDNPNELDDSISKN